MMHRRYVALLFFATACPQSGFNPSTDGFQTETGGDAEATAAVPTGGPGQCGDGSCGEGEDNKNCSVDCHCGNGSVDAIDLANGTLEACDDGAMNTGEYQAGKVCNTTCSGWAPRCGDGACQAQEGAETCPDDCASTCGNGVCDVGEAMLCPKDCPVSPVCGNMVKDPGEFCDEGPTDTATCDDDCSEVVCNDGHLNMAAGEQCEDGNNIDNDACRNDCKAATCGDGVVFAMQEECDDGNDVDDDECSLSCEKPRFVFVTQSTYNGEQVAGVAGGDAKCQDAAQMAGLGDPANTWVAWLSDSRSSPATRVAVENLSFGGWYLMRDSQGQRIPVAKGWAGLIDGMLDSSINMTETGELAGSPNIAWTNTAIDGTSAGLDHCNGWTSSDDMVQGVFGRHVSFDQGWTRQPGALPCFAAGHLYCIEMASEL